ncbi:TPA: DUF551 domain-containing protein [Serratia fonticola]
MTTSTKRLTTAELRQIIDSHEKGHAMIVPINCDYLAAKELLAVREATPVAWASVASIERGDVREVWPNGEHNKAGKLSIAPLFTGPQALPDEIKQVLLWALWHHLGGCSDIGQPIRKFLGIGANERLTDEQLITAKAYPASVAEKRVISDSWIACSERMPTDETTVLVSNEEGVVWIADVDHGGQFYPDEFPVAKMSAGEITHWMPIPAAPTK